jgi:hypothetical protein
MSGRRAGTVLRANDVRIYSGSGTNSGTTFYMRRREGMWDNTGDCARLVDLQGRTVMALALVPRACQ